MKPLLYAFSLFCCVACTSTSPLETALRLSGDNRPELEKVLAHYRDDSLKYVAACFLIENMPGKYGTEAEDVDEPYKRFLRNIPQEDPISWELDLSVIATKLDSVSLFAFPRQRKVEDLTNITADYLIDNIDWAFRAWEESPYTSRYSFDDFLRYVLPYRVGNEPLTQWRSRAYRRYRHLMDSVYTPRQVATSIALNEGIRYNVGMTKYPYVQSYEEMAKGRWGLCGDLAAYQALSLRAIGIPASCDFVPAWANRNSGHCWGVLKDTTGRFIDLGYDPDGENRIIYKVSKVNRKEYASAGSVDVTSEYAMPQSELCFPVSDEYEGRTVSLCTFNNRDWVSVAFAVCRGGNAVFPSVGRGVLWGKNQPRPCMDPGRGIVYVAKVFQDGIWIPVAHPVVLHEDGTVRWLQADEENRMPLELVRKYPYYGRNYSRPYDSNCVRKGDLYELRYWKEGWQSLGLQTAESDNSLRYDSVPRNALLWLHNHSGGVEERIFTYENGKQVWW